MVKRRMVVVGVLASVLGCVCGSFAAVSEGMVLLNRHDDPTDNGSDGALVLKYLSDGREVVLEDCCAGRATFSPDGKKVAFVPSSGGTYTMNLDGSDRREITASGTSFKFLDWCTNGYMYCKGPSALGLKDINRIPENGGPGEGIYDLHHDNMSPAGGVHGTTTAPLYISLDGTKIAYTNFGSHGIAQSVALIHEDKGFAICRPCVASISTHGDLLGKSNPRHNSYFMYPWKLIYRYEEVVTSNGLDRMRCTYCPDLCYDASASGGNQQCPWYVSMFKLPDPDSDHHNPHWSKDNNIVVSNVHPAGDPFLFELSSGEFTWIDASGLPDDYYSTYDYYPRELSMTDTSLFMTPVALDFETEIGDAEMPESIMVYIKSSHTLPAPTVSGAPAWLSVTAEKFDDDNVYVTNAINQAGVPSSTGSYTATITVSFAEFRPELYAKERSYTVTLNVFEQRPDPIRFVEPAIEEYYETADTIKIGYSADCERAGDKINIAISVDNGASWGFADTSYLGKNCGENQVFEYIIPERIHFYQRHAGGPKDTNTTPVEGSQCLIRLKSYHPGGTEVYSSLFGINQTVAGEASRPAAVVHAVPLSATLKASSHATVLSLRSSRNGAARVLDIQGRTVARFAVETGTQSVMLPRLRTGCYLLQVQYAGGGRETAVVNLL